MQSNLNSSNIDGSFTMANSNSYLSSYDILPKAQGNKYLGKYSYFIDGAILMSTLDKVFGDAILMSTLNIPLLSRKSKKNP